MTKAIGLPRDIYPHYLGIYFCNSAKVEATSCADYFTLQVWRIRLHIPTLRGFKYLFTKDAWKRIEWIDKHNA